MAQVAKVSLFGPHLYSSNDENASRLVNDLVLIEQIRKTWTPTDGPNLFVNTTVGAYDKHMATIPLTESSAWTRKLQDFPDIPLVSDAPARLGFMARGTAFLRALQESFPVPDEPFWHAVAEQTYGYIWAIQDTQVQCAECVRGAGSVGLLVTFIDYYHFADGILPVRDVTAQRVMEYIDHVHKAHEAGGGEQQTMDSWLMSAQTTYLDILHPKNDTGMQFPDDELRSVQYRLVNSACRALAVQARLEQKPHLQDDALIDAIALALLVMHDACDRRHDTRANEYYNIFIIISAHNGMESVDMIRRFCIDVWAWAIDHGSYWVIRIAGRLLAWQLYMARYQTPVLFDNLTPAAPAARPTVDPYGDSVLNMLNPLSPSADPTNFDLRHRCQDKARYDELHASCLAHIHGCPGCRGFDTATWENRVPMLGNAYQTKYTDNICINTLATYMVIEPLALEHVWLAADSAAKYTGPTDEWSPMLC